MNYFYAMTRTIRRRYLYSQADGLFPALHFGARFGLTQHRVDNLLCALTLLWATVQYCSAAAIKKPLFI